MLIALRLFAADEANEKKKGGGANKAAATMMKKLESVDLTAEQKTKLESLAGELNITVASLKEEGFTPDLMKKKAEAMKAAREEGKKGKKVEAEVMASMNLTDPQQAMMKKMADAQLAFTKGVANTLTEEQMGQLPEAVKMQLTRAKGGVGKGKKEKASV